MFPVSYDLFKNIHRGRHKLSRNSTSAGRLSYVVTARSFYQFPRDPLSFSHCGVIYYWFQGRCVRSRWANAFLSVISHKECFLNKTSGGYCSRAILYALDRIVHAPLLNKRAIHLSPAHLIFGWQICRVLITVGKQRPYCLISNYLYTGFFASVLFWTLTEWGYVL